MSLKDKLFRSKKVKLEDVLASLEKSLKEGDLLLTKLDIDYAIELAKSSRNEELIRELNRVQKKIYIEYAKQAFDSNALSLKDKVAKYLQERDERALYDALFYFGLGLFAIDYMLDKAGCECGFVGHLIHKKKELYANLANLYSKSGKFDLALLYAKLNSIYELTLEVYRTKGRCHLIPELLKTEKK